MAYLSKEKVAKIRAEIKKEFPAKQGWKFSVTIEDYSGVRIAVMKSPLNFADYKNFDDYTEEERAAFVRDLKTGRVSINENYINENWKGEARRVFAKLKEIADKIGGGSFDRNAGDPYADYSNYSYYIWLQIGKWDRPCEMPWGDEVEEAA